MQTTKQLLDRAKKVQGIESDYKLAQVLGVVNSAVTNYRAGRSHPDDAVAAVMMALGAAMLFGAPSPQGAMASTLPYDGNGPGSVHYVKS